MNTPTPRDLVARAYRATRRALAANDPAAFSAECLALMATAAASGTIADAMAAHQAAARHDALYWASRAALA